MHINFHSAITNTLGLLLLFLGAGTNDGIYMEEINKLLSYTAGCTVYHESFSNGGVNHKTFLLLLACMQETY
jgi:hypothetical protein